MIAPKKKYIVIIIPVIFITVIIASLSVGIAMFGQQVEKEVKRLYANSKDISEKSYSINQITNLPEPVQRYFKYSLQENQNYISFVKLKHGGTFRQSQGQGWIPMVGQEYFTTENPGFVWIGKMKPYPLLWIDGKDEFIDGKGNFQIKLLSLFTVADTKGKESDESELLRWLAETPWFPTALLPSKYLLGGTICLMFTMYLTLGMALHSTTSDYIGFVLAAFPFIVIAVAWQINRKY